MPAVRPPSCAGSVYPAEPAALRRALDRWVGSPARPGGDARASPRPGSSLAPHIDYPRGARG